MIDEIPYGIIRKNIVESVAEAGKRDLIKDVSAVNDESGRQHAVRIVIDLKRDADPNVIINQLYQYTPCQITVSMINIALVNRQPRTMGLKELIQHFIEHRREVITRRTRFLLRKAQQREHILEGLIFAVADIDEIIRLIRSSSTREEAIDKLMRQGFRIDPRSELAAKVPERITLRHPEIFALEEGAIVPRFRVSRAQAEAIGPNAVKKTRSKIANAAPLGPTVRNAATGAGAPWYTSGAQLWNGAAEILNAIPTNINAAAVETKASGSFAFNSARRISTRFVVPVTP